MNNQDNNLTLVKNQKQAYHVVVVESQDFRKIIILDTPIYSIGRAAKSAIVLPSKRISRHHATIIRRRDVNNNFSYWILDGDLQGNRSTNGIFVNNKKCFIHALKKGDVIQIAIEYTITYDIYEDLAEIEELQQEDLAIGKPTVTSKSVNNQVKYRIKYSDANIEKEQAQALQNIPSDSGIIEIDWSGKVTFINAVAKEKFKYINQAQLNHPLLADLTTNCENKAGSSFTREVQIGSQKFKQYVEYLSESNLIRTYIFNENNRKQIETDQEDYKRYSAIIQQASEGILLVDAATKKPIEANNAYCNLLGYTSAEILQLKIEDLVAKNQKILEQELQQLLEEKVSFVRESIHRHKNGSLIKVEVNVSLIAYEEEKIFCFAVRDLSKRNRKEDTTDSQTIYDLGTGLPNKTLLIEQLSTAIANAKRNNQLMAIVSIELDQFEELQNTLSNEITDELLKEFAQRLRACFRSGDTVARWESYKFVALLPQVRNVKDLVKIGKRTVEALQPSFKINNRQIEIAKNIGIAVYPQDGTEAHTLLEKADTALAYSQEIGGNNYQFYSKSLNQETAKLLRLETLLQNALEQQQFFLVYQPQVNVALGKIVGVEALLRWQHPEIGIVSPTQFIPLAEETGLIVPISKWVLKTACTQSQIWQNSGLPPISIGVNLSAQQFQQPNLVSIIEQLLKQTQLAPHLLELEITENTIIQNFETTSKTIRDLQAIGVSICMDNFGTGNSSLGYLTEFDFHTLKIDRSLIRNLPDNPQNRAIISAAIAMGNNLQMRVVAEGVETMEQLELIRSFQCEEIQGYFFSRPLSAKDTANLLASPISIT